MECNSEDEQEDEALKKKQEIEKGGKLAQASTINPGSTNGWVLLSNSNQV